MMRSEPNTKRVNSAKDLAVYKLAYELAMEIFELSKGFPSGGKVCVDHADSSLVAIGLPESARGVGEASVRG